MTLTEEKAKKWSSEIDHVLREGNIKHVELEGIIGKLSFSQTMMFGKFARSMMRPLYRKLYANHYSASLTNSDRRVLVWRQGTILTLEPK